MTGKETTIVNPVDSQAKKFKFDYSYWSHDGYIVCDNGCYAAKDGTHYVDQVSTICLISTKCMYYYSLQYISLF